ncbi:CDP-alcohol phosphatidyltransferase family protein [Microbulbifer pacificus]|uniref:CDP-diacylglycerol--glycerol-3-phosphate 3-phosphatidyltransferase n=1 Tax=Microbulbifer pacificus TaxID=407164 RepID=A0AAU0MUW6_9GAMM|nr:CDP-alcohol phosphatidyltransferase family protein [Microbulbifer pacificus]WOX03959.1 CDP-alcohol phosphatidyltransferase family protein [Microbulbifer pacificus]
MTRSKGAPGGVGRDPSPSRWRHLPNLLCYSRLALIPVIIWLTLKNEYQWALATYCVAALTDLLDGKLARRYGWVTRFGSFLDPIVDRIFVLCLIPLLWYFDAIGPLYTSLVVVRYAIQLSVLPVLMGWLKKPFNIAPDWISKLAALVVYAVLGMGFADLLAIELFYEGSGAENIFDHTIDALTLLGTLLEILVLYRFVPRYWQIIRARHDTLE